MTPISTADPSQRNKPTPTATRSFESQTNTFQPKYCPHHGKGQCAHNDGDLRKLRKIDVQENNNNAGKPPILGFSRGEAPHNVSFSVAALHVFILARTNLNRVGQAGTSPDPPRFSGAVFSNITTKFFIFFFPPPPHRGGLSMSTKGQAIQNRGHFHFLAPAALLPIHIRNIFPERCVNHRRHNRQKANCSGLISIISCG